MSGLMERARNGQPLSDVDIVDGHGHLGQYEFPIFGNSAESLVEEMDRIGVRQIVVSHTQCMMGQVNYGNEVVWEGIRAFPGRIFGYAVVWPGSAEEVKEQALLRLDQGFVGIKLHSANGFPYDHPHYASALELVDERGLAALFHTWGGELTQVRRLAERHPRAKFVLAHAGTVQMEEYLRMVRDFPNVYLDTAFSRSPMDHIAQLVKGAGADRVVYGSDCTFMGMAHQIGKILGAKISEEEKRMLLGGTARRIFGGLATRSG